MFADIGVGEGYAKERIIRYSRERSMLKRGQPSLYKLKEGRVNEECSCEQEHLLDEWTRSIGKLIKWVTLASHLLSLLDTACRFVMLLPAE